MNAHALSTSRSLSYVLLAISLFGATLIGCSSDVPKAALTGPKNLATSNESEQAFDLNGDGKFDVWRHYTMKGKSKVLS